MFESSYSSDEFMNMGPPSIPKASVVFFIIFFILETGLTPKFIKVCPI